MQATFMGDAKTVAQLVSGGFALISPKTVFSFSPKFYNQEEWNEFQKHFDEFTELHRSQLKESDPS